jgi:hypothetical protein
MFKKEAWNRIIGPFFPIPRAKEYKNTSTLCKKVIGLNVL